MSGEKKPLESAASLKRFKDRKPRRARALALAALAAAAGFALFFLIRPQPAPQSAEGGDSGAVLIARDKTLLGSITVALSGAEPYTLINQNDYDLSDTNDVLGEEYRVEGDPDFAVSTARVLPMEGYATDLPAVDVAARAPEDLAQYGLARPAMTVRIGYRDGSEEALRFGGEVPTGSGYYLQRAGDAAVYIVSISVYEAFHRPLDGLRQTEQERAELEAARAAEAGDESAPGATGEPDGTAQTAP